MLSGASQAEASRATQDLVHGLATGTLNMRQFRGVMMQMPDLTKRIADGLGVSQEKLFEMMHTGLSTKDVLAALSNEAGKIDTDFAKLPMTFARAWTVLTNSVEQYVGQASQAGTVSGMLKDAIVGIANHIDTVATGFEAAAVAAGLWLGGKTLQGISGLAVAIKDAALGQGAYASAAAVAAAADAEAAAAKKAALGATIAQIDAQTDLMVAELNQNRAIAAQIMATNGLTEAQLASLPVGERIVELEAQIAAARARVVLAEEAETAATAELAAAQTAAGAASGLFTRASQGLLAMIGGWPAVAVAAVGGLVYIANMENDLEKQTDKVTEATLRLREAQSQGVIPATDEAQAQYDLSLKLQATTKARLDALLALQRQNVGVAQGQFAVDQYATEIAQLTVQEKNAAIQSGELAGQILKVKLAAAGKSIWSAMFPDFHADLSSIQAAQAGIDKQVAAAQKLAATYGKGKAAVAEYDQQLALDAAAQKYSGQELEAVTAAIKAQYAPLIAADKAVDAAEASHKAFAKSLKDTAAQAKLSAEGMKSLTDMVTKLDGEVGGPAAKAWTDYVATVEKLDLAYAKAVTDGKNYADAQAALVKGLADAKQKYDDAAGSVQTFDDVLQNLQDTYAREEQLAGMSTQARRVATEVERAEKQALQELQNTKKAGEPITQDEIDRIRREATAHVQNMEAIENQTKAQQQYQQIAEQGLGSMADAFGQFFTGQIKSWHDLGASIVGSVKNMIAQVIAEYVKLRILGPLVASLFGSGAAYGMSFGGVAG